MKSIKQIGNAALMRVLSAKSFAANRGDVPAAVYISSDEIDLSQSGEADSWKRNSNILKSKLFYVWGIEIGLVCLLEYTKHRHSFSLLELLEKFRQNNRGLEIPSHIVQVAVTTYLPEEQPHVVHTIYCLTEKQKRQIEAM